MTEAIRTCRVRSTIATLSLRSLICLNRNSVSARTLPGRGWIVQKKLLQSISLRFAPVQRFASCLRENSSTVSVSLFLVRRAVLPSHHRLTCFILSPGSIGLSIYGPMAQLLSRAWWLRSVEVGALGYSKANHRISKRKSMLHVHCPFLSPTVFSGPGARQLRLPARRMLSHIHTNQLGSMRYEMVLSRRASWRSLRLQMPFRQDIFT